MEAYAETILDVCIKSNNKESSDREEMETISNARGAVKIFGEAIIYAQLAAMKRTNYLKPSMRLDLKAATYDDLAMFTKSN